MNAIEVKNVSKNYGDFLLDNISFKLPKGTIMGLVGENGAGKSTIINIIMNAKNADSGSVFVLGVQNISKEFFKTKQDIGIVLDEAYFPELLTVKDISKIMKLTYKNWSEEIYFSYIKRFSLPIDKSFLKFSRGMKMKLSIAVALSHNTKLLILDEPTSGLDPMVREEILEVFNEFTREEEHSILLSSHIISDLEKICDYITFIHKGSLILSEEKDLIMEKYAILKLSDSEFESISEEAIVKKKKTVYGYELLAYKDRINAAFRREHIALEDIILFMGKEEK